MFPPLLYVDGSGDFHWGRRRSLLEIQMVDEQTVVSPSDLCLEAISNDGQAGESSRASNHGVTSELPGTMSMTP